MKSDALRDRIGGVSGFAHGGARADATDIAVAANFTEPAKETAALFKQKTGHESGAGFRRAGAFFTQITHGAPFEVFLSADSERPRRRLMRIRGFRQPVHLCDKLALREPGHRRDQRRKRR